MAYLDSSTARGQRRPSPLNLHARSPASPTSTYSHSNSRTQSQSHPYATRSTRRTSSTFPALSPSPFDTDLRYDSDLLYDVPGISPPATPGTPGTPVGVGVHAHAAGSTSTSTLDVGTGGEGGLLASPGPSASTTARGASPGRSPRRTQRERSTSRTRIVQSDLERFAEYCRKWYFDQDPASGKSMTQTLAAVPLAQRASYTRVQGATRAAFHRAVRRRRDAAFLAHLSMTQPGASLSMAARREGRGRVAREERRDRFARFVGQWCTLGMPGTEPFFAALHALLVLQTLPASAGGAGRRRMEWELDDAVFKEAAGQEFMTEAVDVLKGVLGFEERAVRRDSLARMSPGDSSSGGGLYTIHSRSQSAPLKATGEDEAPTVPGSTSRCYKGSGKRVGALTRARAPSDPFLDSHTPTTPMSLTRSQSSCAASSRLYLDDGQDAEEEEAGGAALRVWVAPDLADPELVELERVLPAFVRKKSVPRFGGRDVEEGVEVVRCGAGRVWAGAQERADGWGGSWWRRVVTWLRKTFC